MDSRRVSTLEPTHPGTALEQSLPVVETRLVSTPKPNNPGIVPGQPILGPESLFTSGQYLPGVNTSSMSGQILTSDEVIDPIVSDMVSLGTRPRRAPPAVETLDVSGPEPAPASTAPGHLQEIVEPPSSPPATIESAPGQSGFLQLPPEVRILILEQLLDGREPGRRQVQILRVCKTLYAEGVAFVYKYTHAYVRVYDGGDNVVASVYGEICSFERHAYKYEIAPAFSIHCEKRHATEVSWPAGLRSARSVTFSFSGNIERRYAEFYLLSFCMFLTRGKRRIERLFFIYHTLLRSEWDIDESTFDLFPTRLLKRPGFRLLFLPRRCHPGLAVSEISRRIAPKPLFHDGDLSIRRDARSLSEARAHLIAMFRAFESWASSKPTEAHMKDIAFWPEWQDMLHAIKWVGACRDSGEASPFDEGLHRTSLLLLSVLAQWCWRESSVSYEQTFLLHHAHVTGLRNAILEFQATRAPSSSTANADHLLSDQRTLG